MELNQMVRLTRYLYTLAFGLILTLITNLSAEETSKFNTLKLADHKAMPAANIDDLAWIAGKWQGEMFGGMAEEVWNPPSGGSMMGMYKLVKDDKVVFYELMLITEISNSLTYRLKHFNPDLTGWEEKDKYVDFPLVKVTTDEALFDGFTFRKLGEDKLQLFLRDDSKDGSPVESEFIYQRTP